MPKRPSKPKRRFHFGWRGPVIALLTIAGIVCLVGFMVAHWTERQLLTTDNYVKLVEPLPKNEQVASSLSTYTIDQLFSKVNLEGKIAQALPPKASFLAQPLTERLDNRLTNVAKNIIQSDQFQNVWVFANKTAHEKLMNAARNENPPPEFKTNFNLDLSSIREDLQAKLGLESQPLFSGPESVDRNQKVNLQAKVSTRLQNFKKFVNWTDFLNGVLWLVALVCLLGALVFSNARRKQLIIIGIAILVVGLLQLMGVKALRPGVLNHIQNEAYRPAVGVVYDSLTASFNHSASFAAVLGALIALAAYFTQTRFIKQSRFLWRQVQRFTKTGFYEFIQAVRGGLHRHWLFVVGALILLGLIFGAFAFNLDWEGIVRLALVILIAIEVLGLIASRQPLRQTGRKPM